MSQVIREALAAWLTPAESSEHRIPTALRSTGVNISLINVAQVAVNELETDGDAAFGFISQGDLVVGFNAYTLAPGSAGAATAALSDPEVRRWLGESSVQGRAATISPLSAQIPQQPEEISQPKQTNQQQEPAQHSDRTEQACVALTFDDGPSGSTTPKLLEILTDKQATATFFMLGQQVRSFPDMVADIAAAGHEIGNHTWEHPSLPSLDKEMIRQQIADTNRAIADITGRTPTLLRPPYGATDEAVTVISSELGMAQIMWNIDTRDWDHHDPAQTLAAVKLARQGDIILMHDIHAETIAAVADVIDVLREQGLTLATISDMLGDTSPGKIYYSARSEEGER